jgi:hypothetical protein
VTVFVDPDGARPGPCKPNQVRAGSTAHIQDVTTTPALEVDEVRQIFEAAVAIGVHCGIKSRCVVRQYGVMDPDI